MRRKKEKGDRSESLKNGVRNRVLKSGAAGGSIFAIINAAFKVLRDFYPETPWENIELLIGTIAAALLSGGLEQIIHLLRGGHRRVSD